MRRVKRNLENKLLFEIIQQRHLVKRKLETTKFLSLVKNSFYSNGIEQNRFSSILTSWDKIKCIINTGSRIVILQKPVFMQIFQMFSPCRKNTTQFSQYVERKPLRHSQFLWLYARLQSVPKWWESVTDTLLDRRVHAVIILDRHLL